MVIVNLQGKTDIGSANYPVNQKPESWMFGTLRVVCDINIPSSYTAH